MTPAQQARDLLRSVPLIDGHNDFPWQLWEQADRSFDKADIREVQRQFHTDIPRLIEGGLGGQFWSVYVPCETRGDAAVRETLEQIDIVYRMLQRYPDVFGLALCADDVLRLHGQQKIASLIGMEGGHCIAESLATLRMFYRLGARYMTLTHNDTTSWADSATDEAKHGGLAPFGFDVVREMNELGMLIDLSHTSDAVMHQVLDASRKPIVFTHSSARALCNHVRNVPDEVLQRVRDNGGVVMVAFVPSFVNETAREYVVARREELARSVARHGMNTPALEAAMEEWDEANPKPGARLEDVVDHIDHIRDVAGIDHVGIGGDFDGIPVGPAGLEDVSKYAALIAELFRRGYSDRDVGKVAGQNVLRILG